MKMRKTTFILIMACIALMGVSCKKKGCTNPLANNYQITATEDDGSCTFDDPAAATEPTGFTPTFSGTFAMCAVVKSVTTTVVGGTSFDSEIGTAIAVFSEDGGANNLSAGTVMANSETLTQNDNNSYTLTPTAANPTGLVITDTYDWTGSGAGWPAFSATTTNPFPAVTDINSGDVNTGSTYTLSCSDPIDADSVYFGVYGTSTVAYVILGGGVSSYTFSAAELSGIGSGSGFVQIVGINYDPQTIGGRSYWFINETARTKQVTID